MDSQAAGRQPVDLGLGGGGGQPANAAWAAARRQPAGHGLGGGAPWSVRFVRAHTLDTLSRRFSRRGLNSTACPWPSNLTLINSTDCRRI